MPDPDWKTLTSLTDTDLLKVQRPTVRTNQGKVITALAAKDYFGGGGGGGSGLVLLPDSSHHFATAADRFDIVLPAGYSAFQIHLSGVDAGADALAAAFSSDGGATFFCDPDNSDTYSYLFYEFAYSGTEQANGLTTVGVGNYRPGNDSIATIGNSFINDGFITVYPGDATHPPRIIVNNVTGVLYDVAAPSLAMFNSIVTLCPIATLPPTLARCNLLRVFPYGDGNCDPPSGNLIAAGGTIFTYGIPDLS